MSFSAIAFCVGFAVLGAEMAAARLMAPYYGTSTVVWALLITAVMGSAALGQVAVARWAPAAHPGTSLHRLLHRLLLGSGAILLVLPWLARPLMRHSLAWFATGDLLNLAFGCLAVLALLAPPMAALGAAGPLLLRCAVSSPDDIGPVAARLYAAGTFGSLLGALIPGLWAVPLLGSGATMAACGGLLLVAGSSGLFRGPFRWAAVAFAALASLIVGFVVPSHAGAHIGVIDESETQLNHLTVTERDGVRRLLLGEGYANQSIYAVDGRLPLGDVWGYAALAPAWTTSGLPARVLMLGLGGGTNARTIRHLYPRAAIVGVELDAGVVEAGRRYFDIPGDVEVVIDDARRFLARDARAWDVILIDAFQFPYVPFQLVTAECFATLDAHLAPGGVVVLNIGRDGAQDAVVAAVIRTAAERFATVRAADANTGANTMVVLTRHPPADDAGLERLGLPSAVNRALAQLPQPTTREPAPDAWRLTDERAPVEWLTDLTVFARLQRNLP